MDPYITSLTYLECSRFTSKPWEGAYVRLRVAMSVFTTVKVVLKRYWIRRASASARMLCPFPEYSPVFQNTILIVSEDLDGYRSISEGLDDYHMISGCRDKYHIPI